jgi:hypothetical protein
MAKAHHLLAQGFLHNMEELLENLVFHASVLDMEEKLSLR